MTATTMNTTTANAAHTAAPDNHAGSATVYVAHIDDHGMREQSVHDTREAALAWVEAGLRSRWAMLFDTPAPTAYRALVRESWNEGLGVSCAINSKQIGG